MSGIFVPTTILLFLPSITGWKSKKNDEAPKEFLPLLIGEQYVPDRKGIALPAVNKGNKEGDSVPLEFVFPNGTKMILKASIDPALLKTIVHLYD